MFAAVAMLAAAALGADNGWAVLADPQAGVQVLRPSSWSVEALGNDAVVIKAVPPLQGSVMVVPVSAPGASSRLLVASFVGRLGGTVAKEMAASGYSALVQYQDAGSPGVPQTALVAANLNGEGRGLLGIASAPATEWVQARPALTAILGSFKLEAPIPSTAQTPAANLRFEPFRELKEQAFGGELPDDWKKETSIAIVPGANPYVRASAVARSADKLYAFLHYKLASFQVPMEEIASTGAGFRDYQPGAEVLEKYLFPAVAKRAGADFAEWKITKKGGVQPLFSHPSGVRFDGEQVEYTYRYKGEAFLGRAFVTTYHLPGTPASTWFLYALAGYEGPAGREETARTVATRLLSSFAFEGRYAPQADLFWTLSRDAALRSLSAGASPTQAPVATGTVTKRTTPAPTSALEAAALALTEVKDEVGKNLPVQIGAAAALQGSPSLGGAAFGDLRTVP
ncbi:MAG TPA: hypothetical protein VGK67_00345 [Myxococcales bacterium]|jgi:hypothetical protein